MKNENLNSIHVEFEKKLYMVGWKTEWLDRDSNGNYRHANTQKEWIVYLRENGIIDVSQVQVPTTSRSFMGRVMFYFTRAIGVASVALLVTGKSSQFGWTGIDLFMIVIWLWSEWDNLRNKENMRR